MKNDWRQWVVEAEEVSTEVEVSEQFQVWTVADEASLEGLALEIGWELWYELQEYCEKHLAASRPEGEQENG